MIKGCLDWQKATYYSQTNNPIEQVLKKLGIKGYLESCGPTAMVNCLSALGYDLYNTMYPGGYIPQPEQIVFDFFNDPVNYPALEAIRKSTPPNKWLGNRVPQFYPYATKKIFNKTAVFFFGLHWNLLVTLVLKGYALQLCLKKPGHYIAAIAYDDVTKEIIYNDPWPKRKGLKNGGKHERLDEKEFTKNIQPWAIKY